MKKILYIVLALAIHASLSSADTRHSLVKKGNRHFEQGEYGDSVAKYKEAILKGELPLLDYNLGNALYKDGSLEGAAEAYINALNGTDPKLKSQAFHNIGNALIQAGKTEEAVKAYINSLKLDPSALDTKQNLEYALRQMQQQQQQQQDQEQDQNQDKEQDQDQEQQQQNRQDQQQKDEQDQEQQEQQQQQQDQEQQQDQQPQQEQQAPEEQMSKQDAMNILDALQNDEKDVQEKVIKQQNAGKKPREKNW